MSQTVTMSVMQLVSLTVFSACAGSFITTTFFRVMSSRDK